MKCLIGRMANVASVCITSQCVKEKPLWPSLACLQNLCCEEPVIICQCDSDFFLKKKVYNAFLLPCECKVNKERERHV